METILKNVGKVWNPVAEVRRRQADGTLTVRDVIVPMLLVIVACSLAHVTSVRFVADSVEYGLEQQGYEDPNLPFMDHPLIANRFALEFLTVFSLLAPLAVVALLPARVFFPAIRNEALAAIIIVSAAGTFYLAAIGAPLNSAAGVVASGDAVLGKVLFGLLLTLQVIVAVVIVLVLWIRAMHFVLSIPWSRLLLILVAYWATGSIFNKIVMGLFPWL